MQGLLFFMEIIMDKQFYNTCAICGKEYKRCKTCEENRGTWASWKQFVDSSNCFQIFATLRSYNTGSSTQEAAKAALEKCDLSKLDDFLPDIKKLICDIMKTDETKRVSLKKKKE